MSEIEKRMLPAQQCELRAVQLPDGQAGAPKIVGYAAVFNTRSDLLGGFFVELIAPGAFDEVLTQDTRGLFNHDPNYLLGRTTSGTLRLSVDARGLAYEIDTPDTLTIRDLVVAPIARGDMSGSSFAMRVAPGAIPGTKKTAWSFAPSTRSPSCATSGQYLSGLPRFKRCTALAGRLEAGTKRRP